MSITFACKLISIQFVVAVAFCNINVTSMFHQSLFSYLFICSATLIPHSLHLKRHLFSPLSFSSDSISSRPAPPQLRLTRCQPLPHTVISYFVSSKIKASRRGVFNPSQVLLISAFYSPAGWLTEADINPDAHTQFIKKWGDACKGSWQNEHTKRFRCRLVKHPCFFVK